MVIVSLSLLFGCGSAKLLPTPIENIDTIPIKTLDLTEAEERIWSHLDLVKDTIPGMSIKRAYDEIIKDKKGQSVIVAVIDSGVDIDHEDLNGNIWINTREIPGNGIDDDQNGYIDDIYGWNFLGDGYDEQFEYVRILAKGDTGSPEFARAEKEHLEEYEKYTKLFKEYNNYKPDYEQFIQQITYADKMIAEHLNNKNYTSEDVNGIITDNPSLKQALAIMKYLFSLGFESSAVAKKEINNELDQINKGLEEINDRLNYHLVKDFKGRKNDDDPDDMSTKYYGNGNVKPIKKGESHGTHVAGIIASIRDNNKGMNGVANNVKIMAIRAVPNGDEYDKDIALAIKYAVNNGAKVINMSFGKYYSPHPDWVQDAIVYAANKDVLIVNGAGNEGLDLDEAPNYPTDQKNGIEVSNNFLTVGATGPNYESTIVAEYSNYGKGTVDVFAPGSTIYSTYPENEYEINDGTSMAAPAVAGIAALIRSYYPNLSAEQVKRVIMESGLQLNINVQVGGDPNNVQPFKNLSKSSKLVNAYNALILAEKISKQ